MAESRWEAECKRACPDGCGKGLRIHGYTSPSCADALEDCQFCFYNNGDLAAHHHLLDGSSIRCTAPPRDEWGESQAIRSEEAERRIAELLVLPEVPEWEQVVQCAYHHGDDGALKVNRITAHYNSMRIRTEEAELKLADTEQLFESYRINAAHAAKLDREALEQDLAETKTALVKMGQVLTESMASEDELEQELDSLKARMEGAMVCQECGGASTIETAPAGAGHADDLAEYQKCPACKAGIVWPQEVKP